MYLTHLIQDLNCLPFLESFQHFCLVDSITPGVGEDKATIPKDRRPSYVRSMPWHWQPTTESPMPSY